MQQVGPHLEELDDLAGLPFSGLLPEPRKRKIVDNHTIFHML